MAEAVDIRMRELGLTQKQVGVSPTTIRFLIRDHRPIARRDARAELCEALGWTPDSIDRMLAGQAPAEIIPSESIERIAALEARFDDLAQKVEQLLDILRAPIVEGSRRR